MKSKTFLKVALASALAIAVAPANALQFYYNAYGGFEAGSDSNFPVSGPVQYNNVNVGYQTNSPAGYQGGGGPKYPGGNGYPPVTADTAYQQVGWGSAQTGHSNLSLNEEGEEPPVGPYNPVTGYDVDPDLTNIGHEWISGGVEVDDVFGSVMGWLTHHNEVISEPFIGEIGIHYHLDYYADAAKTIPVWSSDELDFVLQIWETSNSFPCPDNQATNGPCDDRFAYKVEGVTDFGDTIDLMLGQFNYMGTDYQVSSSGFLDDRGIPIGFGWSGEQMHNSFYVNHHVKAVMEPSSIALMGIGILGFALAANRRRRNH